MTTLCPRHPFREAGPSPKDVLVTCVAVGGILGLATLALNGAEAFRSLKARWSAPLPVKAASAEDGASSEIARLAGRWVGDKGARVIITAKGEVWSDSGKMEGWVSDKLPPGAEFAFGDGRFFCAYAVKFIGDNAADWSLVSHSEGTPCPTGHFARPFSFSN